MRIENFRYTERFGSVIMRDVQKVLELDSGRASEKEVHNSFASRKIDDSALKAIEQQMAIVIPTKNEKLRLFDGVMSGVPHECLKIIVSNSEQEHFDRFAMERETLKQYCQFTKNRAYILHQKDPFIVEALEAADYTEILNEEGVVRDGKAEGMILGILLAKLFGKKYIGFIDADNYFPATVLEYVRSYAAGLSIARLPAVMVRILWHYKPKVLGDGLYFKKWGRVSQVTNRCINSLISVNTGFETDVIKTGNAGEHAMTMELAEIIPYASSYAIEPQELISIFEHHGGVHDVTETYPADGGIEIFQIETRNPHLHEEKGGDHLKDMLLSGLGAVYHSPLCKDETKHLILEELCRQEILEAGQEPPQPLIIPPPAKAKFEKFKDVVENRLERYTVP